MEEKEQLAGRTRVKNKPLTCYLATIKELSTIKYTKVKYIATDLGDFRLLPGMPRDGLEVGQTYFLQTIKWKFKVAPIEVVDYVKI